MNYHAREPFQERLGIMPGILRARDKTGAQSGAAAAAMSGPRRFAARAQASWASVVGGRVKVGRRASRTVYDSYIVKRTQIYLDEKQEEELGRRASAEGLTKSALIRRAVDAYLNGADDEEFRLARFKAAVEAVAGVAPDLPKGSFYVERLRALDVRRQEEIERRRRA
jgi:predicted DNA-binding protein